MTKQIKRGPEVVGNIATYYGEAFGDVLAIFTLTKKDERRRSLKRSRQWESIKEDFANSSYSNFVEYITNINVNLCEGLCIKSENFDRSAYNRKKEMEFYREQVQAEIKAQALAKVRKEIDDMMSEALIDVARANAKGIRAVALKILDNVDEDGKLKDDIKIDTLLALLSKTKLELGEPGSITATADNTSALKNRLEGLGIV